MVTKKFSVQLKNSPLTPHPLIFLMVRSQRGMFLFVYLFSFTEFVHFLVLPRSLPTDALTKFHERPNFFLKSDGSFLSRALKRAVAKIIR